MPPLPLRTRTRVPSLSTSDPTIPSQSTTLHANVSGSFGEDETDIFDGVPEPVLAALQKELTESLVQPIRLTHDNDNDMFDMAKRRQNKFDQRVYMTHLGLLHRRNERVQRHDALDAMLHRASCHTKRVKALAQHRMHTLRASCDAYKAAIRVSTNEAAVVQEQVEAQRDANAKLRLALQEVQRDIAALVIKKGELKQQAKHLWHRYK